jgi:hypothetical protein
LVVGFGFEDGDAHGEAFGEGEKVVHEAGGDALTVARPREAVLNARKVKHESFRPRIDARELCAHQAIG